jgi:hypothetical protein
MRDGMALLTFCFHPLFPVRLLLWSWRWRQYVPAKHWLTLNRLHSVISQKIVPLIAPALRTSNPAEDICLPVVWSEITYNLCHVTLVEPYSWFILLIVTSTVMYCSKFEYSRIVSSSVHLTPPLLPRFLIILRPWTEILWTVGMTVLNSPSLSCYILQPMSTSPRQLLLAELTSWLWVLLFILLRVWGGDGNKGFWIRWLDLLALRIQVLLITFNTV